MGSYAKYPSRYRTTNDIDELKSMWEGGYISEENALKSIQTIISTMVNENIKKSSVIKDTSKVSFKSIKKRKSNKSSSVITKDNIGEYIKAYIESHPEIIESYIKNNLRIDFKKVTTMGGDNRFALALFDKGKPISTSTLCLNLY